MSKTALIGIGAVALIVAAIIGGIGASLINDNDDDADDTVTVTQAGAPAPAETQATQTATQVPDNGGVTVDDDGEVDVETNGVDVDDQPIPANERQQAERAVLQIAGGGTVTDLNYSDDPGERYEAEVVRDDGSEIDIALDEQFNEVANQPYED